MRQTWSRFDEIRSGGWDPRRAEEMDGGGVDAEVLYPTPRLSQSDFANTDPECHFALVQAYNDWLSEYVASHLTGSRADADLAQPGRRQALAEIDRVLGRPGDPVASYGLLPERHAGAPTRRRSSCSRALEERRPAQRARVA